ncbi:hypothetical protein AMTRI_Chr02g257040 [Amborella trichopoda]
MSLIPSIFGQRNNVLDPFSLDIWDPFHGFFPSSLNSNTTSPSSIFNPNNSATSAFLNAIGKRVKMPMFSRAISLVSRKRSCRWIRRW